MKTVNKNKLILTLGLTALVIGSGCSTARTRSSDPVMRVAIDADSISPGSYARLVRALVDSRKFIVVDRASGMRAIAKEQELQHTTTRFGTNEKYALWGRMYGVGGIFVGVQQCRHDQAFITHKDYLDCVLNLSLINSTTGEVMTVSESLVEADDNIAPEWKEAVEIVIAKYPKTFINKHDPHMTVDYDSSLVEYREKTVPDNSKKELKLNPEDRL